MSKDRIFSVEASFWSPNFNSNLIIEKKTLFIKMWWGRVGRISDYLYHSFWYQKLLTFGKKRLAVVTENFAIYDSTTIQYVHNSYSFSLSLTTVELQKKIFSKFKTFHYVTKLTLLNGFELHVECFMFIITIHSVCLPCCG